MWIDVAGEKLREELGEKEYLKTTSRKEKRTESKSKSSKIKL